MIPNTSTTSSGDRAGYLAGLLAFALAVAVFVAAPFLALNWARLPFPGFVVESTLVVAETSGAGWAGRAAGLDYPQRVTALNGIPLSDPEAFDEVLARLSPGQTLRVDVVLPGGAARSFEGIPLGAFPARDLLRMFFLPYAIGLAYLGIGAWVLFARGQAPQGSAFSIFCFCAAVGIALIFDLSSSRQAVELWTLALPLVGGSMIRLALYFPSELPAVQRRPWLGALPLALAFGLACWGWWALHGPDPWAYVNAWRGSYIFVGLGILALEGMMLYQQTRSRQEVARRQARIVLLGSLLAFTPVAVWTLAPLFGLLLPWNPALFAPPLILFPLSIAAAIARYRLWDLDFFVNRTLVYVALTLILALLFFGLVLAFRPLLGLLIGRPSPLAIAVATLAISALFNPLRLRLQNLIDRHLYREKYQAALALDAFLGELREEVDLDRLVDRLEEIVWQMFRPGHIFTWLRTPGGYSVAFSRADLAARGGPVIEIPAHDPLVEALRHAPGALLVDRLHLDSPGLEQLKKGQVRMAAPLVYSGELVGWLSLGPQQGERVYSLDDRSLLSRLAVRAAPAVQVALLVRRQQEEALERERMEQELRLAERIQHSLLPRQLPRLPGWDVAVHYRPAREVGGDFYDFVTLEDGRLGIFVGDVTGKGIPAALLMATTRSILRVIAQSGVSPGETLRQANEILADETPPAMFVTCYYAVLDPAGGDLRVANAGHNLPYLRREGGAFELHARGMPLGLLPGQVYEERAYRVIPGEGIVLYSDGLVEAHNPLGEMFSDSRLQAALARPFAGGQELNDCLLSTLADFTGEGWEQEDDITLVTLLRTSWPH